VRVVARALTVADGHHHSGRAGQVAVTAWPVRSVFPLRSLMPEHDCPQGTRPVCAAGAGARDSLQHSVRSAPVTRGFRLDGARCETARKCCGLAAATPIFRDARAQRTSSGPAGVTWVQSVLNEMLS